MNSNSINTQNTENKTPAKFEKLNSESQNLEVIKFKRALISVSDKTGLVEFLKPLVQQGLQIVSTGGTKDHLKSNGIPVTDVSEQTGFPEVMDGRVKTLHPRIHMALLARANVESDMELLKQQNLQAFDLVVVNLYPFQQTLEKIKNFSEMSAELIEKIDVGGPSMLRAAAKNFSRIAVVTDPMDYQWIADKNGQLTFQDRKHLAGKVFQLTAQYDALIAQSFLADMHLNNNQFIKNNNDISNEKNKNATPTTTSENSAIISDNNSVIKNLPTYLGSVSLQQELRYGENPHQKAFWLKANRPDVIGWQHAQILQGKALSYNNLLDLEAAFDLVKHFDRPGCVAVKHNNPCGAAIDDIVSVAIKKACESDPVSVFGGIIAVNHVIDEVSADYLSQIFLECIVAPDYTASALEIFAKKKNLRLLQAKDLFQNKILKTDFEFKSILGGLLVQQKDNFPFEIEWNEFSKFPLAIQNDILFGEKLVASLKSNAIAIVADGVTVGLGMGQVNRVDSVKLAIERMKKFAPQVKNPVLISDAFFPFPDSVELIAQAGIQWVIQPGGSLKDNEVIQKAKELNVQMLMTKTRHFRH